MSLLVSQADDSSLALFCQAEQQVRGALGTSVGGEWLRRDHFVAQCDGVRAVPSPAEGRVAEG